MSTVDNDEAEESRAGVCYADFQPGDRIYGDLPHFSLETVMLGTVRESRPNQMIIDWDDGYMVILSSGINVDLQTQLAGYGKPLDLANLKAGDTISRWHHGWGRAYAKVLEYIPNELLSFASVDNLSSPTVIQNSAGEPDFLERRMLLWELEG